MIKAVAGPEMDAAVAEHVFGTVIYDREWPCGYSPSEGNFEAAGEKPTNYEWLQTPWPVVAMWHEPIDGYMAVDPIPHYSSNLLDAREVIEEMDILEYNSVLRVGPYLEGCLIGRYDREGCWITDFQAATAPLAICIAALRAKGIEVEL